MSLLDSIKSALKFKSPVEWFYENTEIVKVEWWLSYCHLYPDLFWARLRIFSDGKVDVLFQDENKLFGFDSAEFAGYFISEDEFIPFDDEFNEEDRDFVKIPKEVQIQAPIWENKEVKNFKYIGKY